MSRTPRYVRGKEQEMTKSTDGTWNDWTGETRTIVGKWRMAVGEKVMPYSSDKM